MVASFGEILLRLSTPANERILQANSMEVHYGGSESNVVASLSILGHNTKFISRVPANEIGNAAINSLRTHGVDVSHISKGGDRLGIYFLETGTALRQSNVLYDRKHSAFSYIRPDSIDWNQALNNVTWFHWSGITPAVSQAAAETLKHVLKVASDKGIFISADLNYRKKLWDYGMKPYEVMPELIEYCDMISGGNEDSEPMFGIKVPLANDDFSVESEISLIEQRCFIWKNAFPKLKYIASTIRRSRTATHNFFSGALWDGKEIKIAEGFEINPITDRVGGGDAFMAGIIHGLICYPENTQKAIDFAVAAGALKHTIKGDVNLSTISEIERMMTTGNKSLRIIR
ncbi:MAG: PfkB family carbohydrate kinase [Cytophagaceae bacterium]